MTCVRTAWLDLDGTTVALEDAAAGYFCTKLDLGAPVVREVLDNLPDQHGAVDRTAYMGSRAVSADVTAVAGAGAVVDDVATMFGPFMVPTARPVLHYVLDSGGTARERTLVVRPAAYDYAIEGDQQRDIHLGFVAADPIARDPRVQSATAWAGFGSTPGRAYPLTFDRTYPAGGGVPTVANLYSAGDVPIQPAVRIWGPITGPAVTFTDAAGAVFRVPFVSSFTIAAGSFVDVDTKAHTALYNGDPAQNMLTDIDWTSIAWPVLDPYVTWRMSLAGTATSGVTQVVATWQDGYLS
jgi:hypothetical protein